MKKIVKRTMAVLVLLVTLTVRSKSTSAYSGTIIEKDDKEVVYALNVEVLEKKDFDKDDTTVEGSEKVYGSMNLCVAGFSVLDCSDNKQTRYFVVIIDAMSNARGSVSTKNKYSTKKLSFNVVANSGNISSDLTTIHNGLSVGEYKKTFALPSNFDGYVSYKNPETQATLNKITANTSSVVSSSSSLTTVINQEYSFADYSSSRSYPNCGEYHQRAICIFGTSDVSTSGINFDINYSLTIFRDVFLGSNHEVTKKLSKTICINI